MISREQGNSLKNSSRNSSITRMCKLSPLSFRIKNQDLFKDQTDYTVYDSNYTRLGDRRLGHEERLDRGNSIEKGYKFMDKLPDNFSEKQILKEKD